MDSRKLVICLVDQAGRPIRIFRNRKEARQFPSDETKEMLHGDAVKQLRDQVVRRADGRCEMCGEGINCFTGEMHERHARGKRINGVLGEYSLENSCFVCVDCHRNDHPEKRFYSAKVQEF